MPEQLFGNFPPSISVFNQFLIMLAANNRLVAVTEGVPAQALLFLGHAKSLPPTGRSGIHVAKPLHRVNRLIKADFLYLNLY